MLDWLVPTSFISVVFGLFMLGGAALLAKWHLDKDCFTLKDAITAPGTDGVRRVDTSKFILVGVFFVSSYLLADNYTETGLGIYLGAWIINGGAVLAYKIWGKNGNGNGAPKPS